jgi:hypothetical protein
MWIVTIVAENSASQTTAGIRSREETMTTDTAAAEAAELAADHHAAAATDGARARALRCWLATLDDGGVATASVDICCVGV